MSELLYDLVVIAGGGGRRLGGRVKADLEIGGQRLVDRTFAATGGATRRVLVGEGIAVPDDVLTTLEDPPAGGPAAGTAAGLDAITDPAPWTLLLAGDLADPAAGIAALLAAADRLERGHEGDDVDGICLAGDADHPHWLFGIHRTRALAAAVTALGDPRDQSMQALLAPLRLTTLPVTADTVADIDTPADLETWAARRPEQAAASQQRRPREDAATLARWRAWVELAADAVGADPDEVDIAGILQLTKQIAHGYDRPMAPVGAYVLGLAVGAAHARGEDVDQVALRTAITRTLKGAPPVPEQDS